MLAGYLIETMPFSALGPPLFRISLAALLATTIQRGVSLRWQTFTGALGFGMSAMSRGVHRGPPGRVGPRYPWSAPMHAIRRAAQGPDVGLQITLVALVGAWLVATAGAWEFSRREVNWRRGARRRARRRRTNQ